jgi:hypothetical protein
MSDAGLTDVGRRKAHARSDIIAAAAIAHFYDFAGLGEHDAFASGTGAL